MGDTRSAMTLDLAGLQTLVDLLAGDGFTVLGPTVRDGAIVPGPVGSLDDLPRGRGRRPAARQLPAHPARRRRAVRVRRRPDQLEGGDVPGPGAALAGRRLLRRLHRGRRPRREPARRAAVRPDRDPLLRRARARDPRPGAAGPGVPRTPGTPPGASRAFLVTVVCSDPSGTCFCVSMGTGPRADAGYDLALTELLDGPHRFLVAAGSDRGAALLDRLPAAAGGGGRPRRGRPGRRAAPWPHGPAARHHRHPGPALPERRARPVGRRRRAVPVVRQLHDGLPDLLLHLGGGPHRPLRRLGRAVAGVGLVLHRRLLPPARRQTCGAARGPATASG